MNHTVGLLAAALLSIPLLQAPASLKGAEPDFFTPGGVSVTIEPALAAGQGLWQAARIDAGGKPVIDGARWLASGQTDADLSPGRYLLVFSAPSGWAALDPIPVHVPAGAVTRRNVSFGPVPVYDKVQDISPQTVRLGDALRFQLKEAAAMTFEPHAAVQRDLSFAGGLLTYRPTAEEREQFQMTFSSSLGEKKTITVDPQGILPAEQSVIEFRGNFPVPQARERKAYLRVTEELKDAARPFNYRTLPLKLRTVSISGQTVVFERGHENGLFESFAFATSQLDNDNVESLEVYADQVIIREALRLPGTRVTIHARELRFEGDAAALITTPVEKDREDTALAGVRGLDAGDIALNVQAVYAPGSFKRLLLKGGDGQEATPGKDGTGLTPKVFTTYNRSFTADCGFPIGVTTAPSWNAAWIGHVIYYRVDQICIGTFKKAEEGTTTCPRSGISAVANGVPGNGGDAGKLTCPFDLGAITDLSAGKAGQAQPKRLGSEGERPYNAIQLTNYFDCGCKWSSWDVTACGNGPGADKPATLAAGPNAVAGTMDAGASPFAWIHPVVVRTMLQYARDAYLNGYPDEVRAVLEPYVAALEAHPAPSADLLQEKTEIATLLHRLDNNLDYFGFPAGWVPMLSFEVAKDLFEDEVAAAGDILYLSYYLGRKTNDVVKQAAALTRLRAELSKEITDFKSKLSETKLKIGDLSFQAQTLDKDIRDLGMALKSREEALRDQAKLNAALKKAFRVAGNVLPLIPVAQPALGLAGAGLTAASRFNEQSALDNAIDGTNLAHEFLGQHIETSYDEFQTVVGGGGSPQAQAAALASKKTLETFDAGLAAVNQVLVEAKSWESDLDKEVQILAAQDPQHKDLVKKIQNLNQRKRRFAEDLAEMFQTAKQLMAGINQDFLALQSLNRDVVKTFGKIDQEAFRFINEMGQRARDRLLEFQYYLIKAYQYRMVQPFHEVDPDAFQLGQVYDHFAKNFTDTIPGEAGVDILDRNAVPNLTDLYTQQLREITLQIVRPLAQKPPDKTDVRFVELTAEQLAQLNRWDDSFGNNPEENLRLNLVELGGLFDQRQENLRIFDLKVDVLKVSPRGGGRPANVTVHIRHSGESLIASKGETFKFNHYRTLGNPPLAWRANYDAISGAHTTPALSASGTSLLKSLLDGLRGAGETVPDDLVLYSRPSAWADLTITKETLSDTEEMVIDRLVLRLQFDFSEKEAQAELEVKAVNEDNEGLAPSFVVRNQDENSRGDGRGSFRRVYRPGEQVQVEAPLIYGGYRFDRWLDRQGKPAGVDPVLFVDLGFTGPPAPTVSKFRAVYRFGGEAGEGSFRRGDANADGMVDISDAISILGYLFTGGKAPDCEKSADVNDDSRADLSDGIGLLNFLYLGAQEPAAPFRACGRDSTPDPLACIAYGPCR